jgi:surface polysaccharide O-acyltransferase-like enzyme
MNWLKAALVGGTIFWLALFLFGIGPEGDISMINGGLYWQSAAYALWEAFFCVGVCLGIVVIFRERFNSGGRLARLMADNSFAVYFFHPVILILVTAAMRNFALHPLAKFAVAAAVAVPICFLASGLLLRRIPVVGRVL